MIGRWALMCLFVTPAVTLAQGGDDYTAFDLEELLGMDVVYGASAYEQLVSQAPSSVTVVTAEEIRAYGHRTLADVLDGVTGFYTSSDRLYRYVGVRGFNRLGDYGSRLLILVDGHRVNDNVYQTSTAGPEFPVDVDLIKRIEVVRGPSSSLYGSNAFFGVLNIVTRDPGDVDGWELAAAAGSFSAYEGRLTWATPVSSTWQALLSVDGLDAAGDDLYFPEYDDPATRHGRSRGDADQALRGFAKVARGPFALCAAWARRDKDVPTGAWETTFGGDSRVRDERGYVAVAWDAAVGERDRVQARATYDHYAYEGWYHYDDGDEAALNRDVAAGRWLGLEARWTHAAGARHRLAAGLELRRHLRREQRNFDEGAPVAILDSDEPAGEFGVALQDEIALAPRLTLNLGVRHDRQTGFATTNPRLAAIWAAGEGGSVKALFGTAFRAPSAYELYYDDGGDVQKANPDLDPEAMTSYELVWEQRLTDRVSASLAAFHYDVEDLITQVTDPADGLLVFANLDEASASGVELRLDGRLLRGVRKHASYSYQESEDDRTGAALTNSPRHLAQASLQLPLGAGAGLAVQAQAMGERTSPRGDAAAAHVTADVTLSWRPRPDRVTLVLSAYNVLDESYADPAGGELRPVLIPRDGRTWRLKAVVAF